MPMIDYSKQFYKPLSKGYRYGQQASGYDQVASEAGKTSSPNRLRSFGIVLRHAFSARFYPISVICHNGFASVFQDRLSWDNPDTCGLLRFKKCTGFSQAAALYNCSKSSEP